MPDDNILALRQADQARTDFAAIDGDLQFVMGQLARLPTRRDPSNFPSLARAHYARARRWG
jgi:hypothetical protein